MMLLSIGSVVLLNNGERKIMILNRTPLYNHNGTIGYFDYSGCLFPEGLTGQNVFFFNSEDVAEIIFEGYVDENEEKIREIYDEQIKKIKYPKFSLDAVNKLE